MAVRGADRSREAALSRRGFRRIAGLDEVGRGSLAGPVVAAAVVLHPDRTIAGLRDSKRLQPAVRQRLAREIVLGAEACAVGLVDAGEIDRSDILRATFEAMRRAVSSLRVRPDFLLVDALTIPGLAIPQRGIVRGDDSTASIAAASIVAKVYRDHLMRTLHSAWPAYRFDSNKGYGTRQHLDALRRLGATPLHRATFRGVLPRQGALFAAGEAGD
jgi:ribonuclease HII